MGVTISLRTPRDRQHRRQAGFTGLQVLALVGVAVVATAAVSLWIGRTYLWPREFEPVTLAPAEQARLDAKLRAIGVDPPPPAAARARPVEETPEAWLRPEPYREDPAKREIALSEREVNALLAHNTDLARRLALDFSDDLASARLLVPVDPDFPVLGGRTLRVAAGLELAYGDGRPVVILRGVSLMGVPIPNAWLGNLKNVDLVDQFGGGPGVWKSFADGVDFVQVREGELRIKLKE
jgi:hypothetical protein